MTKDLKIMTINDLKMTKDDLKKEFIGLANKVAMDDELTDYFSSLCYSWSKDMTEYNSFVKEYVDKAYSMGKITVDEMSALMSNLITKDYIHIHQNAKTGLIEIDDELNKDEDEESNSNNTIEEV